MEWDSAAGGYGPGSDVNPRSGIYEDKSQHPLRPDHHQASAIFMGQKQGSLANNEMGVNPCNEENMVQSHVSKPPSENPSNVLTSTTPVGAVHASTKVDEDHSQGAVEPDLSNTPSANEQGRGSMDDSEELKESTTSKNDPHAMSESKETPTETEERQVSQPNVELRTPSECNNVCEDKNLETPLPPAATPESFDSSLFSMSMDVNNDSSSCMKVEEDYQIASRDDDSPTSSTDKLEQSSDGPRHHPSLSGELFGNFGSETQYPPTQVMERPADTASPSSYRIPSHVFARESTAGADWSVASNESLFSIHVGNMSFSKDTSWFGVHDEMNKRGETSLPSPRPNMSGDISSKQSPPPPPPQMANRVNLSSLHLDDESRAAEERAAETMREVIRENTEILMPMLSQHSKGSTKSFAFPILADVERNGSTIIFPGKQKTEEESHSQEQEEIPKETQQLNETSDETKQPAPATTATSYGCFSCFSCCA